MSESLVLKLEKDAESYAFESPQHLTAAFEYRSANLLTTLDKAVKNGKVREWLENMGKQKLAEQLTPFEKRGLGEYLLALELLNESITARKSDFTTVAGLDWLKKVLYENIVYPETKSEMGKKYGRTGCGGMLLYGPPGCGKTYMANAVAGETSKFFVKRSVSELMEHDCTRLQSVFSILKMIGNIVLYIDEMEILAANRENEGIYARRLANALLTELGNVREENRLFVIGSTNSPWAMDPSAVRSGRLDILIYVGVPAYETRLAIFKHYVKGLPVVDADLEGLSEKTDFYSCSDIEKLCKDAAAIPFAEAVSTGKERDITEDDFEVALGRSVSTSLPWFEYASALTFNQSSRRMFAPMVAEIERYKGMRKN